MKCQKFISKEAEKDRKKVEGSPMQSLQDTFYRYLKELEQGEMTEERP